MAVLSRRIVAAACVALACLAAGAQGRETPEAVDATVTPVDPAVADAGAEAEGSGDGVVASDAAAEGPGADDSLSTKVDTTVSDGALAKAKATVDGIRSNGKHYMEKEKALCAAEKAGIDEWQETIKGNAAERAKEKAERMKQKGALLQAVGGRLKTLEKFLNYLKGIRAHLGEHIGRTNKLFTSVYDANNHAVHGSADIMRHLGFVVSLPWSPLVTPIKLPRRDKMDQEADAPDTDEESGALVGGATGATGAAGEAGAEEDATGAAGEDTPAAFLELEQQLSAHTKYCKDMELCSKAYSQAFHLYKQGYRHAKQNKAFFERERAALGGFRDGLKKMIKSKEEKKAALLKQQAELTSALNSPQPGLSALFPLIDEHEEIVTKGCGEMKGRSEAALKELQDIEDVLNSKGCTTCTDASTGAAGEDTADESSQ